MRPRAGIRQGLRAAAAAVVIVWGVALAFAAHAPAAPLPGSSQLSLGISDDRAFLLGGDTTRVFWLSRAQALGSSAVRLGVPWDEVAPSTRPRPFKESDPRDPHYKWTSLDAAVREATAAGQSVVLTVAHAPRWAEGPNRPSYSLVLPGAWEPSAKDLGQFAHALAVRYSGHFPDPLDPQRMLPRVVYYQGWNEPNLPRYIMPQWYLGPHHSFVPASPGIYRRLLNAFYAAVKLVDRSNVVLAAGTAPYGDPAGASRDQMYPVLFYREFFCLTPDSRSCPGGPPHFDALDHHPYALTPGVHAGNPGDVSVPDLGRIWKVLHEAQRVGHALPAGPKALWVTEIDWATTPPITTALQTRFLSLGFYVLWREGVSHAFWYEIQDTTSQGNSFADGGLYYLNSDPKPAVAAFRFPFVAIGGPHRTVTLWGKAPHAGLVVIEAWRGGVWRALLTLRTTSGGVFYARRALGGGLLLRAAQGAIESPGFATSGPM